MTSFDKVRGLARGNIIIWDVTTAYHLDVIPAGGPCTMAGQIVARVQWQLGSAEMS